MQNTFYESHNVGHAKYVVNYHDGIKTHSDGSAFFDIRIFKNMQSKNEFVRDLLAQGYQAQNGTETRKIKSLADLKRAITPNVVITVVAHWQSQLIGTTRTPTKIQGNGYFFNGPDSKGNISRMWAETPKASQLRFNEDGTVTYHPETPERSWTLRFA